MQFLKVILIQSGLNYVYAINGNVKLYLCLYCGMGYWGRFKLQYLHARLHAKPHIP